ncbi:unnamed protein product [Heligmosomoides polygyrus]|uniref:Col_cuticle_N domain-containing protein n=1 Tax=Heligmosomoides polygyrus TaxID=6339 RepID=A0A183GAV5_HELPZ|nr:unnamed protein product [Heligmosomoides polygyrus]
MIYKNLTVLEQMRGLNSAVFVAVLFASLLGMVLSYYPYGPRPLVPPPVPYRPVYRPVVPVRPAPVGYGYRRPLGYGAPRPPPPPPPQVHGTSTVVRTVSY